MGCRVRVVLVVGGFGGGGGGAAGRGGFDSQALQNAAGKGWWGAPQPPATQAPLRRESTRISAVAQNSFQFTSSTPLAAVLSRFVFCMKSVRAPGAALAGTCSVRWIIPSPAGCLAITATSPAPDTV